MCGIGGFKGTNLVSMKESLLNGLAQGLKSRGEHATGIGWCDNKGELKIMKAPVKPSAVNYGALLKFGENNGDTIIFHNRYATHGKPEINKNNHPFRGNGYLLAHNGVLSNYKELLEKYKLTISSEEPETDSYAVVVLINNLLKSMTLNEALKELCPQIKGSMVLTILTDTNELILVRGAKYNFELYQINGNEYVYASSANSAYEAQHIDLALSPLYSELIELFTSNEGNFNLKKLHFEEGSIVTIDDSGSVSVDHFDVPKVVVTSYSSYGSKNYASPTSPIARQISMNDMFIGPFGNDELSNEDDESPFEDESDDLFNEDVLDALMDVWSDYTNRPFPTDEEKRQTLVDIAKKYGGVNVNPDILVYNALNSGSYDEYF